MIAQNIAAHSVKDLCSLNKLLRKQVISLSYGTKLANVANIANGQNWSIYKSWRNSGGSRLQRSIYRFIVSERRFFCDFQQQKNCLKISKQQKCKKTLRKVAMKWKTRAKLVKNRQKSEDIIKNAQKLSKFIKKYLIFGLEEILLKKCSFFILYLFLYSTEVATAGISPPFDGLDMWEHSKTV